MKAKIMEILLSADNSLTKEEIDWAIDNIPGNSVKSNTKNVYDHTQENIFTACGININSNNASSLFAEYDKLREEAGDKKSHIIETVIKNGSEDLIKSFVIRGILDYESEKGKVFKDIKAILDKLRDA